MTYVGGMSGRHGDNLHDRVHGALLQALQDGTTLVGSRVDRSKCIDSLSIEQGTYVLEKFGLLAWICTFLRDLFDGSTVWITKDSTTADERSIGRFVYYRDALGAS